MPKQAPCKKKWQTSFDVSTTMQSLYRRSTANIGLMHTLFALEDIYVLKIGEIDGEICLRLDKSDYSTYSSMFKMLHAWQSEAARLENGEITKEEYDEWRYRNIQNLTRTKSGQRLLRKNCLTSSMTPPKKQKVQTKKNQIARRKNERKKPYPFSVAISENQSGFSAIEVFFYSVSDT